MDSIEKLINIFGYIVLTGAIAVIAIVVAFIR